MTLQLNPIALSKEYRKKWNVYSSDFFHLTKDGILISNTLYRKGSFFSGVDGDYFMILKYVETLYCDEITKDKNEKRHLEGRWCILDKNGIEKVSFGPFKSPYLIKDSILYSIDGKYYNIETGYCYCKSYSTAIESSLFLFIDNNYDNDKSKRGVLKINKKTGEFELFQ